VIISPKTIATMIMCSEEGLTYDRDWEKEITQETMNFMLYGKHHPKLSDKKGLVSFLWTANLTFMCRLIHSFLFYIVVPRVGSIDYVSDRDKFCIYKVMVGEKVNMLEVIFFYWL